MINNDRYRYQTVDFSKGKSYMELYRMKNQPQSVKTRISRKRLKVICNFLKKVNIINLCLELQTFKFYMSKEISSRMCLDIIQDKCLRL